MHPVQKIADGQETPIRRERQAPAPTSGWTQGGDLSARAHVPDLGGPVATDRRHEPAIRRKGDTGGAARAGLKPGGLPPTQVPWVPGDVPQPDRVVLTGRRQEFAVG